MQPIAIRGHLFNIKMLANFADVVAGDFLKFSWLFGVSKSEISEGGIILRFIVQSNYNIFP